MTLYSIVLLIHSWLRWLVLATGVAALARGRRSGPLPVVWLGLLDLQVVLGIVLYGWLSPITQVAFADMRAAMHDSVMRFWAVEHAFAMLVALIIAHVGRVMAKRATDETRGDRIMRVTIGLALLCIVAGVPWSAMRYGRPLFRF